MLKKIMLVAAGITLSASTLTASTPQGIPPAGDSPEDVQVTYCGRDKELLRDYYPEEFEDLASAYPEGLPACVKGSAPPGSTILDVPYYNQCSFPDRRGGYEGMQWPCSSGSGPAVMKMALEYAGQGEQDIYQLFLDLWTGSRYGTSPERARAVAEEHDVFDGEVINGAWSWMQRRIEGGDVFYVPLRGQPYERYCGDWCPEGRHDVLVVGISDSELIIHDPRTGPASRPESFSSGENLVVPRETVEQEWYKQWTQMIVIGSPGSAGPLSTPEGAMFGYYPTAWPEQMLLGFGGHAPWQRNAFHTGNDYFGARGDSIYAVADGVVSSVGCLACNNEENPTKGYGRSVSIYHEGLGIYTLSPHLDEILVEAGQSVEAGELLGTMGNTGYASPRDFYHTHFSVLTEDPFLHPKEDYDSSGRYKWLDPQPYFEGKAPVQAAEASGEQDIGDEVCDEIDGIDQELLSHAVVGGASGRIIEEEYVPAGLVLLDDAVPGVSLVWKDQLISEAAVPYINAWVDHLREEHGIYLRLAHGYRDWEAQREVGRYGAAPGHSQHQLGIAFDVYKYYDWTGEHTPCTVPGNEQCEPFLDIIEDGLQYGIVHPIPEDYQHFLVLGMFGETFMGSIAELDYLDDGYYDQINDRIAEVQERCGAEGED